MLKSTLKIASVAIALIASVEAYAQNLMVGGNEMHPTKDNVDNTVKSQNHTTLVAAVKAADLVSVLKSEGPFTVFASTNDAFEIYLLEQLKLF
ncbi:MAG: putative surface protein with fasciclin (FAS1) repeats [Sphingobacteriales bacterium]|jgi:uncharacterized surface protein with fasciclin (FAS1) repeats